MSDRRPSVLGMIKWWIITFVIIVPVMAAGLFASAKIPQTAMHKGLLSSAEYYASFTERENVFENTVQSKRDVFADSILMNMIACTDSSKPVEATVKGEYFVDNDSKGFMGQYTLEAVNGAKPNNYYSRYWHGSLLFLRLMLLFTDAQGINVINGILLALLSVIFCVMSWKTDNKRLSIAYIIAFLVTSSYFAALSVEYMPSYILALLGAIAALKTKSPKHEIILFTALGAATAFFDFLTTETMTALIPLLCILVRKNKEKPLDFKSGAGISLRLLISWFVAYALCFLIKWVLSAQVLGQIGISEIITMGADKFSGIFTANINLPLPLAALFYNVAFLIPTNLVSGYSSLFTIFAVVIVALIVLFIYYKGDKQLYSNMGKILLCVGLLPIIRTLVLANHAYVHSYFTYRALITSVMCIVLFFTYVIGSKKSYSASYNKKKYRKGKR